MGEYIGYKGDHIKLGTLENMYYTSYQKYIQAMDAGLLHRVVANLPPEDYAKPDSGFRFRFPFPDEDHLSFGEIGTFHYYRELPVKVAAQWQGPSDSQTGNKFLAEVEILQQKLIHLQHDGALALALILRIPANGELIRIEDGETIRSLTREIIRNHVSNEDDPAKKNFYRQVAARILKGYRLDTPAKKIELKPPKKIARPKTHRKGLR